MKKFLITSFLVTAATIMAVAQDPKLISDCTVTFEVTIEDAKASPELIKMMAGTTKTLYIKGTKSRSDLEATGFKQSTITDVKSDTVVILSERGNNKFISYVNNKKRAELNKKFEGIQFTNTSDRKTILGYECRKVLAKLNNGTVYNVYYTPTIIPSNTDYEYQFKELPGFVLEYEAESVDGKTRVKYSATKISLIPVPIAKFDLPKAGYRVL